eukprot:gene3494-3992_t
MANDKYKALVQQSNDKLQQSKSDQMAAVHSIRSMTSADQDKEFRLKFNLPEGEFSIISYSCTNDSLQAGIIHLTPFFICFELSVNIGILNAIAKTTETTTTIAIKDVVSLNKIKALKFLPGKGTCVEIKTVDGKVKLFKGFIRRKECLRNIYNQAMTINHKIEMLREGVADNDHLEPLSAA